MGSVVRVGVCSPFWGALTERWSFEFSVKEFRSVGDWQGGLRRERVAISWGPI